MEYNLKLTDEFLEELDEISDYISSHLHMASAAIRLRKKIMEHILLLENSPKLFPEIRQYRRIVVENYVILYTIHETEKIVYVAHIYFDGRNYIKDLV